MPQTNLQPTPEEADVRRSVYETLCDAVRSEIRIRLPDFDPKAIGIGADFALQTVGIEPNPFGGIVGPYRYQFEGEDDLLHLMVMRVDGSRLTPEEGQSVLAFLLPDLPPALVWLKPGELSQHFFFGHDELLV